MKKKKDLFYTIIILMLITTFAYISMKNGLFDYKNTVNYYKVKEGSFIAKGEEITADKIMKFTINKKYLPKDYIKKTSYMKNKIALENLYEDDILRESKMVDKSKWYKDDEILVVLPNNKDNDNFVGNEIRPGDKIDLFIYNASTTQFEALSNFQGIEVINIKNKEGIFYNDFTEGIFVIDKLYFKTTRALYKELVDKVSKSGSIIKIGIHGNRPNNKKDVKQIPTGDTLLEQEIR